MQAVFLRAQQQFADEKFQKVNIFDSPRMFCDIYCFEPGQEQTLHSHEDNDKIYYVLEGVGTLTVGEESRQVEAGWAVLCPPGEDHGVVNTGGDRLVLLVFMAPHP
ncbi:MAG TPA: cupin domain-containing protein [Candidatus Latescibacteria bacterium]|nr:cupin domain-containing protein [Candidatus Latescibacterota bacterium]HIM57178.1 cupin domain-containing protein [Candidatus Latescibacterota bacterium]